MNEDIKLKQCPFCGGDAKKAAQKINSKNIFVVYCTKCGAFGPSKEISAPRIKDEDNPAIIAWNKRSNSDE